MGCRFRRPSGVVVLLAAAVAAEFRAIADYNTALAVFEFAKGTVQQYNNVTIGEGPLPPWVHKKATDHIRERTEAALKLRERDVQPPPGGPAAQGGAPVAPPTGSGLFDSLPHYVENRPLPEPKVTDRAIRSDFRLVLDVAMRELRTRSIVLELGRLPLVVEP